MDPLSPSLVSRKRATSAPRHEAKRVASQGTLEACFDQPPVKEPIVTERGQPTPVTGKRIVDLFSGLGGFSRGAADAGHTIVLAVDNWAEAVKTHRQNHPSAMHARLTLGTETQNNLERLIQRVVPEGADWHLHSSPPCQKLSNMRAISHGVAADAGCELVCWYLKLVMKLKPTTWSFEQVNQAELRGLLQFAKSLWPEKLDYGVFNMDRYGVPQSRKRMIAGNPALIHRLRTDESLLAPAPLVTEIITPPPGAVFMRSSVGMTPTAERPERHGDVRPVAALCWTCTATHSHAGLSGERAHIREFTNEELLTLQTFPKNTKLPGRRVDAVRAIGNSIPCLFAAKMMGQH